MTSISPLRSLFRLSSPTGLVGVVGICFVAACAANESSSPARGASAPSDSATTVMSSTNDTPHSRATGGPILVELFTSQGCSSCPPADRILSQIGAGKFGDDVIALAFHVDYWDYIGWKDPFSSEKWTQLQRLYGGKLSSGRVYTPMLVVDGSTHLVGSRRNQIAKEIAAARQRGHALAVELNIVERTTKNIKATVTATGKASGSDVELWVALTESGLVTKVKRGENRGRKLNNNHIVRQLVRVEPTSTVSIPLRSEWEPANLKVVAFARDPATFAILGATIE